MRDRWSLRVALADDAAAIHALIVELAIYEREPDAVEVTVDELREQLASERPPFECIVAERADGEIVGMALYFQSYSTWRGRAGVYLEDLFVRESERGQGIGLNVKQTPTERIAILREPREDVDGE